MSKSRSGRGRCRPYIYWTCERQLQRSTIAIITTHVSISESSAFRIWKPAIQVVLECFKYIDQAFVDEVEHLLPTYLSHLDALSVYENIVIILQVVDGQSRL